MGRFGSKRAKFRPPKLLIKKIYKVTDVEVIEDLMGRLQFKIQLNNELWVTKKWQHDTFCGMHKIYINNGGSVNSLIGKYICVSIYDDPAGYTAEIDSYDVFISFAKKLENSGGTTFTTTIPIYSFLKEIGRNVEDDATIKIKSNFGDIRARA